MTRVQLDREEFAIDLLCERYLSVSLVRTGLPAGAAGILSAASAALPGKECH